MVKNSDVFLYFVEGKTEEKIIKAIRNKYLFSGKVVVLNPVMKKITNLHLTDIKSNTVIILVFDTDNDENIEILKKNIEILKMQKPVKGLIIIPQIGNLEEELVYGTNIREIKELIPSKSNTEFKSDILKCTNVLDKLEAKVFDIGKFWSRNPSNRFGIYRNEAHKIKMI